MSLRSLQLQTSHANNCFLMPLGISCVVAGNIMSETTKHEIVEHEKARNWLSLSSTVLNSAGYGALAFWFCSTWASYVKNR